MIKPGRALRLARLTKCDERPLLIVPLDHTVTDGPFTDAHGYDELLGSLADNDVDAIVVHKGRLGLLPAHVYARLSVIVHISASTKYAADPTYNIKSATSKTACEGARTLSACTSMSVRSQKTGNWP